MLRATGMVRRIDELGRVVIPKELRRKLRMKEGDSLEVFTSDDGCVCFRKYWFEETDLDTTFIEEYLSSQSENLTTTERTDLVGIVKRMKEIRKRITLGEPNK